MTERLIDRLQGWAASPGRLRKHIPVIAPTALAPWGHRTNQQLFKARAFQLDDDFTEMAARVSARAPDDMLKAMGLARAPFPVTWIEWNEVVRVAAMRDEFAKPPYNRPPEGELDAVERVGYLIEQMPGYDTRFYVQMFFYDPRDTDAIFPCYIGAMYDTENEIDNIPMVGANEPVRSRYALPTQLPKAFGEEVTDYTLLGRRYAAHWMQRMHDGGTYAMARSAMIRLGRMVRAVYTDFAPVVLDRVYVDDGPKRDKLLDVLARSYAMMDGDVRFLICVLSLLQHKWVAQAPSHTTVPSRRIAGGRSLPYLTSHTLHITAPKVRFMTTINAEWEAQSRRRRHEVMGHFCERRGTGRSGCHHEYHTREDGKQECVKCAHLRWWRKAHLRGDASIGFVKKDYVVEAPR